MKSTPKNRGERGIALIIALFALLLLSAIGLAMMYSSSTETSINANFRDKQSAAYASMSGALEARDRLNAAAGDIAPPAGLPSSGAANVIYIINPYGGETVAPWSATNKYADTELCKESISGLCSGSTLPSGSSWYTTKDDSNAASFGLGYGSYKQSTPLPYKWTRITLKTDNMTPVSASGNSPTGNQVCWDGNNQVVQAAGANPSCSPTGAVTAITVTNAGNGYNSTPHISIGAPPSGGTQATGVVNMTTVPSDQVMTGTVTNPGANYTTAPTVTLVGGGGTGATAVASINPPGSPVASVSLASAGTGCYLSTPPTVSFSGGGGSGASATATLGPTTCIYSWSATGSCSGYKGTTQNVGAAGGSGFAGTITFKNGNGSVTGVTITNPGSGYSSNPTGLTGLSSCTPTVSWVLGSRVASLTLATGGGGYSSAPTVNVQIPNNGTTPTGTATLGAQPGNAGQVNGITITSGGSGYTSAPTVSFSGGNGSGAAGTVALGSKNLISSITVTNGGSGYTSAPAVTFSGGGGTGAAATATVSGGQYNGQVFLITSFAQTPSGSKAMTQMEVASAVRSFSFHVTGAITMDGPSPSFGSPNSNNFQVLGNDANSCGETATSTKPSMGVFDNPASPTTPTAVTAVTNALGKPQNYIGAKPAPDVENVYGALGDSMSTPVGMEGLANAIAAVPSANTYADSPGSINMGTANTPVVDVVNGDLSLSGNNHGYGVLLVRGNLTMSGNFSWNGPIFVIGKGVFNGNGGGNGQMTGLIWVAKTKDPSGNLLSTLGSPTINWSGGGGNGVQYDHCWADKLINSLNLVPPPSTSPLKILSTRTVTY